MDQQHHTNGGQGNDIKSKFLDFTKKASQRLVDTGAKTMLRTDVAFLERDVKGRKHEFGLEVYEIMENHRENNTMGAMGDGGAVLKEIQTAFERCHSDIQSLQTKINSKRGEMEAIDRHGASMGAGGAGVASGVGGSTNVAEMEYGDVPSPGKN